MKRWILLAVCVVALATVAVTVQFMGASTGPTTPMYPVGSAGQKASGSKAKAVVEGEHTYHFGTMAQRATGKHLWVVRNEGKDDLILWMLSSTCSCTLAKFKNGEKAVVKPGESTEIALEFETRENNGVYEKGAEIGTNDPDLPQFSLHVKGQVFPAVMVYPTSTASFSTISNDEDDHKSFVAVYSKDKPNLKILKWSSSRPKDVTIDYQPLEPKEAKELGVEKGGFKVTIHAGSNLPLGNFREEVVLTTDHPKQPEVRVSVVGRMTGPVSAVPPSLLMHQVNGKTGAQGDLIITVRNGRETKMEVEKTPAGVNVEISPINDKKGRYRLSVTVPPGSPAREIEGEIVIKTDHPKADRVTVPVSIWVQNAP